MKRMALTLSMLLAACAEPSDAGQDVDTTFDAQMAAQALANAPFDSGALKVHMVCGSSAGRGLFGDDEFAEWQYDGITNGRLIFVSGSDGSGPNVFYRDATGSYSSALQEGALVNLYSVDDGQSSSVWTIVYPATGVAEVHNLVARDGKVIDLFSSSKPRTLLGDASAKIFKANCVRP
jgi:hypothetical protein